NYCRFIVFLFSSRRRHTSFSRDWSSDVCSSDLNMSHAKLVNVVVGFTALADADLRYSLLVDPQQNAGELDLGFSNLLGATIVADMSSMFVRYASTVCPDGTTSDDPDGAGFTCEHDLD